MSSPERDPREEALTASEVRRRAVSGVMSLTFREAAIRALGLAGSLVLARLLTPNDFGAVAFGWALIGFGTILADGGIGAALIRRKQRPTPHELRSMLGFVVANSLVAVALIAAVALPFGRPGLLAAVLALSLPIDAVKAPTAIVAQRSLWYRPLVLTDITEIAVYNAVAIGLVVAGLGVWGLAIAVIIRALAGTIMLLKIGPVGFLTPEFSFATVKPFLNFGITFQGVNVVNTVRDQGLNLVTAAVGGLSVLGIWSLANRILQAIMLVFSSLWRVSFPAVSRLIESGEQPQPSVERALALTTTFTGFVAVAIGGTAPAFVPVAFGAGWEAVIPVLPWAAAGILIAGPVSTAAVGLLYARNRPSVPLKAVIAHTATWFAVTTPLLPSLGAEALGIGWLVGAIVDVIILGRALNGEGVRVIRHCAMPVLVSLVIGVVGWFLAEAMRPPVVAFFVSLACVEGLYLAAMLVARRAVMLDLYRLLRRTVAGRSAIGAPAA